jgi:hypothetical protein
MREATTQSKVDYFRLPRPLWRKLKKHLPKKRNKSKRGGRPSTTVVNSRTVWHHALFDDQGGDDGADGGPEDGEIVE